MKGLKKFKASLPECDRDGVVKIFETSIYYADLLEKAKARAKSMGDRWSHDCSIYKASVDGYETSIHSFGFWDKFIEYRELKKAQETTLNTSPTQ